MKTGASMILSRSISVLLILTFTSLLTTGCVNTPVAKTDPWVIPADKFVFIDRHVSRSGETVDGTCGPGMMIDFPMYSFSKETGELSGMSTRDLTINESLKIVYGDGMSIGGDLGGGASTYLTGIHALPFTKGNIIITGVSPEGVVRMVAGNETIALPAGETWTKTTIKTETREELGSTGACTMKIVTKETIFNGGILEKGKIRVD